MFNYPKFCNKKTLFVIDKNKSSKTLLKLSHFENQPGIFLYAICMYIKNVAASDLNPALATQNVHPSISKLPKTKSIQVSDSKVLCNKRNSRSHTHISAYICMYVCMQPQKNIKEWQTNSLRLPNIHLSLNKLQAQLNKKS